MRPGRGTVFIFFVLGPQTRNKVAEGNVPGLVENAVGGLAAEQTSLAVNENRNQTHQTHEEKEHQSAGRSQQEII